MTMMKWMKWIRKIVMIVMRKKWKKRAKRKRKLTASPILRPDKEKSRRKSNALSSRDFEPLLLLFSYLHFVNITLSKKQKTNKKTINLSNNYS